MEKYQLCLYYSSNAFRPIIDKDFASFKEIDEITKEFYNEEELRNQYAGTIRAIQFMYGSYIAAIKKDRDKKGKIAIVKRDDQGISYIKPLYKTTYALSSPKKLINTIMSKLKNEDDTIAITDFVNNFRSTLYTQYNIYQGINKIKNSLYYTENYKPTTKTEIYNYQRLLTLIKDTLYFPCDKKKDTLNDRKTFIYRLMNDYLDSTCKSSVKINKNMASKVRKGKINKEKSKEISNSQKDQKSINYENEHNKFLLRVIMDAYERGDEPSLLDIEREEYEKELCFFEKHFSRKGNK